MNVRSIRKVVLYDEGSAETLDIKEIVKYLREKLGKVPIETREKPFALCPEKSPDHARKLASIKIQDVSRKIASEQEPLYGEKQYEKRRILGKTRAFGVLYDGFHLGFTFRGSFRSLYKQRSALLLLFTSSSPTVCLPPGRRSTKDTMLGRACMLFPPLYQPLG